MKRIEQMLKGMGMLGMYHVSVSIGKAHAHTLTHTLITSNPLVSLKSKAKQSNKQSENMAVQARSRKQLIDK